MRAAVIGVGKLGKIHLRIYKEIKAIKEIFLVDTDKTICQGYPEYTYYNDYRRLVNRIDLASIATPTSTHFKIAKFFLEHRIPVLVEKPLTQNLNEARKLIQISRRNKTLLFVGHVERYNSAYLAVKKLVRNPLFIECHRLSPYPHRSLDISVVLDLMIHDLDIILDLLKEEVTDIRAKGVKVLSETEDIANARLNFKGGCVANITSSRISEKKERKIRIFMSSCYISLDYANQTVEIYRKLGSRIIKKCLPINKEEPLKKEISDFVSLVGRKSFSITYASKAAAALELALKIEHQLK